jgi:hypothetical protein
MKNDTLSTLVATPRIGSQYIKLKTGKLVEWQSFDETTQTFEIKSSNGKASKVHRRDTEIPTANEEADFLLLQNRTLN